ncbi:vitellin-degrading protease-like [Anopheles bellator]|uniref:vitellin-degrading protease-like n=1 Tax=Anopheles bellator TaxID=139047 RepID=UPI002648B3A6|nr:vitellin-degrading protease-like [Anopheles bellator]
MIQPVHSRILRNLYRVALLAVFVHSALAASEDTNQDRNLIVGGFRALIDDFPYQAGVYYAGTLKCGGTLIGPQWILTAGHCVPPDKTPLFTKVIVGTAQPERAQPLDVIQVHRPPAEGKAKGIDVALLKLPKPLFFTANVQCIDMMTSSGRTVLEAGKPGTISGYGYHREAELFDNDRALRAATVTLMSDEECRRDYANASDLTFCAGFPGGQVDSCQGDSGGPIVVEHVLAGVTSWGLGCARPNKPGIYIKVTAFRDWLDEVVESQPTARERQLCPQTTDDMDYRR